jgi:predicted GIY-YIG superfamily endonuclease
MPTRIQGSASDTPSVVSCHLTCDKRRPALTAARRNCRQVQQWAANLERRLAEHEAGRGARLTQVQAEAGGTWRVAAVEPGTRYRERQLKAHSASRRCPICKAEAQAEPEAEAEPELEAGI